MLAKRWQPLAEVRNEMNRLQAEMGQLFDRWGMVAPRSRGRGVFPALNVWDDDQAIYVEAELPGLNLDELEIFVTRDNQLSLKGYRRLPDVEQGTWYRQERGSGEFTRVLSLPYDVDAEAVTAELKLGVLRIVLPKREEVKPRRIEVKAT